MLSLYLIENIKIKDEEFQKHMQHSFHSTVASNLVTQSQNKSKPSIGHKNILDDEVKMHIDLTVLIRDITETKQILLKIISQVIISVENRKYNKTP